MAIYGTAILALCTLTGLFGGEVLGGWLGIDKNLGGVGIGVRGGSMLRAFGYRDAVSLTTVGGGAALKASSEVIALSLGAGLVKAILVMTCTPFVARWIGLDNPRSAVVFGGLFGTTSGGVGGPPTTDPRLVPYGAMTATFYTDLGCLVGPSVIMPCNRPYER